MAHSTSSAEPEKLTRYSNYATRIDYDLMTESHRLSTILHRFESTCTESNCRTPVSHLPGGLHAYGRQSESIDAWVGEVGRAFRAADWLWTGWHQFPTTPLSCVAGMVTSSALTSVKFLQSIPSWLQDKLAHSLQFLGDTIEFVSDVVGVYSSARLISKLELGQSYYRQVILKGGRSLKEAAGVSGYLTHIKSVSIPKHMSKEAFTGSFGYLDILSEGLESTLSNWHDYRGDYSRVASGVVVDTIIGLGVSALGASGGAAVGSVIGGAIGTMIGGPLGTAAGSFIGGKVGALAGEWLVDDYLELDERVEGIEIGGQQLDEIVVDAVEPVLDPVEQKLISYVEDVASLF